MNANNLIQTWLKDTSSRSRTEIWPRSSAGPIAVGFGQGRRINRCEHFVNLHDEPGYLMNYLGQAWNSGSRFSVALSRNAATINP
jgi:hypothetical protein